TRADNFGLLWQERRIAERRTAGGLLLSKGRLSLREKNKDQVDLGTLGGFELACCAGPTWRRAFEAILVMRRTGFEQHIETDDDVTPAGLIARIEHILERMPQELREQARKVEQAGHRLAGYKDRLGQPFALQGELDGKLAQLAALEADL